MKMNHLFLILFLISSILIYACNSSNIQGTWRVSDAKNNVGIGGNYSLVKLLQQEGPISFRFNINNQMDVLNKNDSIIETYKYKIGKKNAIKISYLNDTQEGTLTFETKNKAIISFSNYSYDLVRK
jgi:hypothetical protein